MKKMLPGKKIKCHFCLGIYVDYFLVYIGKEKKFYNTFANNRIVRERKNCELLIVFLFSVMKIKVVWKDFI